MRALLIDQHRRELREGDLPEPRREAEDDVLFRVNQVGVCGTDRELAAFRFGYGPRGQSFLVPGHEAVGEVIEGGSFFAPGDIVVPSVRRSCNPPCVSCLAGRRDLCLSGNCIERGIFGAHGYFTELAVDRAEDLIRIPRNTAAFAVLVEPASVVEKAVDMALRLHQGHPRVALVVGAGTIGLLAAMVFRLRGLEVDIASIEPPGSPRARMVQATGARYLTKPDRTVDVAIEAAGAPEAAAAGFQSLAPLGVLILLGALEWQVPMSLWNFIGGNQIVAGSVNASPAAFRQAAEDLPLMPADVLRSMIEHRRFRDFRRSFLGEPSAAPKIVHQIADMD